MIFKGIQKTSLVDYPGKIATVFFTAGCNFRCPYCHNGHLVKDKSEITITEDEAIAYLLTRKRSIDAVVISGGEPTLYGQELFQFLLKLRDLGLLVKLDTNGTNPELLHSILDNNLVDYIAMDVKAPITKYKKIVNANINLNDITKSIEILNNCSIGYEFRTTVVKELLTKTDIKRIIKEIRPSKKYFLQNFNDGDFVLNGKGIFHPVTFLNEIKEEFPFVTIR